MEQWCFFLYSLFALFMDRKNFETEFSGTEYFHKWVAYDANVKIIELLDNFEQYSHQRKVL